jgi:hypothetical protein
MRVLILGAGGPAGVNACRALHKAGHEVIAADENMEHLDWCSDAHVLLHMEEPTVVAVNKIGADVVLAQPDPLVFWLSANRDKIDAATYLPDHTTIEKCQDKAAAANEWYLAGLRKHPPVRLEEPWPDWLHIAQDKLGSPFWLRVNRGAGATGAICVTDLRQAFHWIRFWQTRGTDHEWIAEEYLPGHDYAWSSLWYEGELVTSFARERLEYLYPHLAPEGLTGTPTIARVIHATDVNWRAEAAVKAIDPKPHGIMSVDLRCDEEGTPRPTEINAGRGFTTFGLWSLYGQNFLDQAVHLAVTPAQDVFKGPLFDALPSGLTLSRHIDCPYTFKEQTAGRAYEKTGAAVFACA